MSIKDVVMKLNIRTMIKLCSIYFDRIINGVRLNGWRIGLYFSGIYSIYFVRITNDWGIRLYFSDIYGMIDQPITWYI